MTRKQGLFGEMAVRLGFVSRRQLEAALRRQKEIAAQGGQEKLLGLVMMEMGLLSNDQFIALLKESQLDATLHQHPLKPASFGD